jgi:hypothetical protein
MCCGSRPLRASAGLEAVRRLAGSGSRGAAGAARFSSLLVPRLRLGTVFAGSAGSARPGRQSRRTVCRGRASAREKHAKGAKGVLACRADKRGASAVAVARGEVLGPRARMPAVLTGRTCLARRMPRPRGTSAAGA